MSGRRLFVSGERLGGPRLTLTGPDHRHIGLVLRARPGDALTLFDGAGGEVEAEVIRVERTETELALGARRTVAGPAVSLTLLCAVPRGPRMDLLVQKTSELGVARIVPVLTERSVARPGAERADGKRARWEKIAREAARQCGRADLPIVDPPVALAEALAAQGLPSRRLALFEGERSRSLRAALEGAQPEATALLIGPEGGFAPAELAVARAGGFEAVGLGERILRVETAAIVAVALVAGAYGMLG
jgi:16S rRNA (uracil1498-N3)-methyltransferase